MNHIKRARLKSMATQVEAAKAARVSQSTYQRWESGSLSPSAEKLEILAKLFHTTVSALKGEEAPLDWIYSGQGEGHAYFGDVAVHFRGSGSHLLLNLTSSEFKRANMQVQTESAFLTVSSMDNRTVFIRKEAIADIYFSSEACQDSGPKGVQYDEPVEMRPQKFWEHVDTYVQNDDFAHVPEADKAFRTLLEPTDADFEEAVRNGRARKEDRDAWMAASEDLSARLCGLATKMYWQMGAIRREALLDEESDVLGPFMRLDGAPFDEVMGTPISVAVEEQHKIIHINPKALDYISVPSHKYDAQNLQMLDELDV